MILNDNHLILAFDTLINHFDINHQVIHLGDCHINYPIFLTWNFNQRLRGCLGTFNSLNLLKGIKQYSLLSALKDKRFKPIDYSILPGLSCAISVLFNFTSQSNWNEFTIGKHGIKINFLVDHINYNAVYLPNVLTDQNWNKIQSITSLVRKSGYEGNIDEYLLNKIKLQTFESEYRSLSYPDYLFLVNR